MNNLLMQVENEIAVVTINRPKALNALNSETLVELNETQFFVGRSVHRLRIPQEK